MDIILVSIVKMTRLNISLGPLLITAEILIIINIWNYLRFSVKSKHKHDQQYGLTWFDWVFRSEKKSKGTYMRLAQTQAKNTSASIFFLVVHLKADIQ